MIKGPFYRDGLRFSCRRCSSCCRYESGFVFLSEKDVRVLSAACTMEYADFVKTWCRWIPSGGGRDRLSLREKTDYDCIFWKDGCTVYGARPLQCRTFPFWPSIVDSRRTWNMAKTGCPGMDSGAAHSREEIEACLAARGTEPLIMRISPGIRGL
ncbi:MAG: YkgJ family cysteine cluster protein [Treponema sp.]|nr:YkgJ family cysteine cluster protein [Treponema sp.]